jgi:hypothetical protein
LTIMAVVKHQNKATSPPPRTLNAHMSGVVSLAAVINHAAHVCATGGGGGGAVLALPSQEFLNSGQLPMRSLQRYSINFITLRL